MSSIAEAENENRRQNVNWGIRHRLENGTSRLYSRPCYGYENDSDGELVINEQQAEVVRLVFSMYLSGKAEKDLLHEYVYGFIAHSLLEDRDTVDFLFSNNMIYTFDFGEAFGTDDFSIRIMENASEYASFLPAAFLSKFTTRSIEYHPETLFAYEVLVNDLQICDKAYFDAALEDMCSRFLVIPEEEIKGLLNALGAQYPAALVSYFEKFIDEMRKFCQK